ncbi:DNA-binding protein (plasmid) [Clostridium estertheticum]|uniref:DNA-binding protein n=1 Tax=Clostridium estertheticum TaxID=238834 RepID=UPI001C0E2865|nr:DNA-binding protein [Clostridium estertheticum]MBU3218258.1 DNA-binding protein [Clostridium estertheticum]WAG58220.1 DNA-binding protein [Clostridium estertheticum]
MNYITTKEAPKIWGITDRMVVYHCSSGWINGAKKTGNTLIVHDDTEKPADERYMSSRVKDGENK